MGDLKFKTSIPVRIQVVTEQLPIQSTGIAKKQKEKQKTMQQLVFEDNSTIFIDYKDDLFADSSHMWLWLFWFVIAASAAC